MNAIEENDEKKELKIQIYRKKIQNFWIYVSVITVLASMVFSMMVLGLFKIMNIPFPLFKIMDIPLPLHEILSFLLVFLITMIVVSFVIIKASWTQVPHMTELIVEYLGEYIGYPLTSKLHFILLWFDFFQIRGKVPMGDQILELYLENGKEEHYLGDIEFMDSSASVTAFLYFKIIDSEKATYYPANILTFIREKTEGVLRSFLGQYTTDEAIKLKGKFSLNSIIKNVKIDENSMGDSDLDITKSEFYTLLARWGMEPISLTVADVNLPVDIKEQRARKLKAQKDLEVREIEAKKAEIDKKIKIIEAEASKEARIKEGEAEEKFFELQGQGLSSKVGSLISKGVPVQGIVPLMIADMQWTAVAKAKSTDKTVIVGSNSNVGAGAEFGAGFKTND